MESVSSLVEEFNATSGFVNVADYRIYEAAILSDAFTSNFSQNIYTSLKPALGEVLRTQERLLSASRDVAPSDDEIQAAINQLGQFTFASNTQQAASLEVNVDGDQLNIEIKLQGIKFDSKESIINSENSETSILNRFSQVTWLIPSIDKPVVDEIALARARRIVSFTSCNQSGGAGACCGHLLTEEVCHLRVCDTEYNKPKIYALVCKGVKIEKPNPLAGCTNFPSEDDWRPACK